MGFYFLKNKKGKINLTFNNVYNKIKMLSKLYRIFEQFGEKQV